MDYGAGIESAPDKPLPRDIARKYAAARPSGRPIELTEEIASTILENIAQGSFLTVAAAAAGVHEDSVAEWLRRARGDMANGLDTIFVRFAAAYSRAKTQAEVEAVAALQRGGDGKFKDWRAQAWWLERRHKDRWSLPKEQAGVGLTLALNGDQLASLIEALKVATMPAIDVTPDPTGSDK